MKWLILFFPVLAYAADQNVSIQIRSGMFVPADGGDPIPIVGFVPIEETTGQVSRIQIMLTLGDRLVLSVTNNHTEIHHFTWATEQSSVSIAPGASETIFFEPKTTGAYVFMDGGEQPFQVARGLSGAVMVKDPGDSAPDFIWFFNEHDAEWLSTINGGTFPDPASYRPDYFTINGNSYPETMSDPQAAVVGEVNQAINIWMVNGGIQAHSIHFHGYHVEVLSKNGNPFPQPYLKDTLPVKPGEGFHTRLVPYQPGLYPVRDHSLTAVTARGFYPNGMLVVLNISEATE